ncbi:exodeoxyribonuclease VII large subunit [Pseudomethylobacillus aquaticus]|uniref:Exodeoxyribonuclease 7 large subunit n=2 Tax=Pseudomethylobacillus aquaticus TaxID=2676064 RepID=A0A3N0V7L1_9PROT|nr:exodeoxyribonuclease VII large subunit [Pseudomethylobacillus aquaticus]ROH88611.1 exodeoxyribonuclease VII large subunit [Pseudomethylobacillus aquaticus]
MPHVLTAQALTAQVLTVSELNRLAREVLERSIPLFWVSGEVSNFTRAASGHWYFSLKDQGAQVRCVMFRGRNSYLDWQPREGDKVEARALVTLYEARGDFQLTVESLQRAGLGALFEAFERLRMKLQAEGLFDAGRKRALPALPRQIGIVTSPDAAALRDVLTTLKRRMPGIPVVIYPTPVQGKGAAERIAAAIQRASERAECDVLIVCRGGGSIEDLWQFNEEIVARAIASCSMPVISGVGHETDTTMADFVADQRAPTPTAAAELATPDRLSLLQRLSQQQTQLHRRLQQRLQNHAQQLDFLARRLLSPSQQLAGRSAALNQLQWRLQSASLQLASKPAVTLKQLHWRLQTAAQQRLQYRQQQLVRLSQSLSHLNPQAVLSRGYALVHLDDGTLVRSSQQLETGSTVRLVLGEGEATAVVDGKSPTT